MENIPICKRPLGLIIIGALCSEYANQIQIKLLPHQPAYMYMYDMYIYSQVTFVYLIRA